jgi:hypothetical protein
MAKGRIRKRIPGGGRHPQGPVAAKRSTFATRITVETREWLEAEAERLGWSLSQVAERVLMTQMKRSKAKPKVRTK